MAAPLSRSRSSGATLAASVIFRCRSRRGLVLVRTPHVSRSSDRSQRALDRNHQPVFTYRAASRAFLVGGASAVGGPSRLHGELWLRGDPYRRDAAAHLRNPGCFRYGGFPLVRLAFRTPVALRFGA